MEKECSANRGHVVMLAVAACLSLIPSTRSLAGEMVNTGYFGDVAILGYDPVAYFTDGHATKGSPKIASKWLGATWYFASDDHRKAFKATPVRYAPQYGGFCAAGVSLEEASANIDPQAWRIVDGKLYLFSGKEGLDEDFDANPAAVKTAADAKWPKIEANELQARKQHD